MSVFLWCALSGCGLLVVALLLDGLLDALDGLLPDGALVVIAAALGGFGAVGLALQSLAGERVEMWLLIGIPLAAALGLGGATRWLWKRLRSSMPRNSVPPTPGELVGEHVRVLWWKNGRGEVIATARGHHLTLPASSEDPLRGGATAVVLDAQDSGLVITTLQLNT